MNHFLVGIVKMNSVVLRKNQKRNKINPLECSIARIFAWIWIILKFGARRFGSRSIICRFSVLFSFMLKSKLKSALNLKIIIWGIAALVHMDVRGACRIVTRLRLHRMFKPHDRCLRVTRIGWQIWKQKLNYETKNKHNYLSLPTRSREETAAVSGGKSIQRPNLRTSADSQYEIRAHDSKGWS